MSKRPFSSHNLELGEDAVNRIINLLKTFGYPILRNELSRTFSQSQLTPEQASELHKLPALRFDIFIGAKGKDTPYLAEIKGKELERFKNWVDKDLYDCYFELVNLPYPLLYFIWIKETDKIYRHEITNPNDFEIIEDFRGALVYLIPPDLIHEVRLQDDILLRMCMTEDDLVRSFKRFREREIANKKTLFKRLNIAKSALFAQSAHEIWQLSIFGSRV